MAPATTVHPTFERLLRIQANTGEQLILFLPSLWLFSLYLSALWAAVLGLVWILARAAYAVVYEANPDKRAIPFAPAFAATVDPACGRPHRQPALPSPRLGLERRGGSAGGGTA
jgi:hypothetical protein